MSTLLSTHWYRVAALRPRLRSGLEMARHRYRGQRWFVLRDPASGRTHRYSPGARFVLAGMDGARTVASLWAAAQQQLGEGAPTQDEMIALLGQLHAADLMQCDVTPDAAELFERAEKARAQRARQSFANPMSIKVPLVDPNRFLDALVPVLRSLWNRWGLLAWLALVLPAGVAALVNAEALAGNIADTVFAPSNLVLLALLFPLIKLLHEIGHGIAVKMGGGEVHDMGVMLLVLLPVPYVDASAANGLRSKWARAGVAAAGMMVELALASLAMGVWLLVEPGLVRSIAWNTMLVAGVSTLVFNGNPLLRYDGYFILADLTETPNLGPRANRSVAYLLERWFFGVRDAEPPADTRRERVWLFTYAVLSFAYRMLVTFMIIVFIAAEFFFVGVLLALWAGFMMLLLPLGKVLKALFTGPRLAPVRSRAVAVSAALLGVPILLAAALPLPHRTATEGVLWMPEQALVRAGADGFHSRLLAAPGELVSKGQPVLQATNPLLETQARVAAARVAEIEAQLAQQVALRLAGSTDDPRANADLVREQLLREQALLGSLQRRLAALVVEAPSAGRFVAPQAADREGRFFRKGELLGYVVDPLAPLVRVVVPQGEIGLLGRGSTQLPAVQLRRAHRLGEPVTGRVLRVLPGGSEELPSRALGAGSGGTVPVDPRDASGTRTLERSFQLEIALPPDGLALYGGRVHVRFEHASAPLAQQLWRPLRQLLLSRFGV